VKDWALLVTLLVHLGLVMVELAVACLGQMVVYDEWQVWTDILNTCASCASARVGCEVEMPSLLMKLEINLQAGGLFV
jgi:hypothetical protein